MDMKRLIVIVMLLVAPAAFATNGYFTHGQGTISKAMAGANTALAQEVLDTETNPAAAAFVDKGYSLSLALFNPERKYTIDGVPSGMQGTFGLTPGTVESKSTLFPMPSFGLNMRPTGRDAVAFNIVARGGMNTDYRARTFYGSDHTGVDLAQMFVTTTWARKLTDNHALGVTAVIAGQRFKASGLEAFSAFSSDSTGLTGNGYDTAYGFGVRVGYLGRLTPKLSVGAAYAPRIHMSEFSEYRGLFAEGGGFDVPTSASAGIAYKLVDPLTITLDWQRIHYSDVNSVGNPLFPNLMTSPLGTDGGAGFGWEDINVAKMGLQWRASDDWTWRAGYSKADQPIPSSEVLFNILAPGVVKQHITVGGTKALVRGGNFNFSVMYAPSNKVTGANPLEVPGQQTIELEMHEWELELGYSVGF
jgi:long-chain fatty acid transport protein